MENSEKLVSIPEMTEIIKKNFTQQVEVITPELAMEYLKKNTDNRPMRERHVRELAKEMEEGRWQFTGDSYKFDWNGVLLDGQHTLKAQILSGCTIIRNVQRGLPPESFIAMDSALKRTPGDGLMMVGVGDYNNMAALIKKQIMLQNKRSVSEKTTREGHGGRSLFVSAAEIKDRYLANQEFYNYINELSARAYRITKLIVRSEYGGFAAYLMMDLKKPQELVEEFFLQLGEVETERKPSKVVTQLRQLIVRDKAGDRHMSGMEKQMWIMKAWNIFSSGIEEKKDVTLRLYKETTDKDIWFK